MDIEYIYPRIKKRKRFWDMVRYITRWVFIAMAYAAPIVNIAVGGKPWCLIVIWSLWLAWWVIFSPPLVEFNRISHTSTSLVYTCILLILIDTIYSFGWGSFVIPIVAFGTLVLIGVLFLSDITKQRQNIMPMVWLITASLLGIIASLIGWPKMNWPMITLGSTALALLMVCVVILRKDLLKELEKRFHIK